MVRVFILIFVKPIVDFNSLYKTYQNEYLYNNYNIF